MRPQNWPDTINYTNKTILNNNKEYPEHNYLEGVIIKEITNPNHKLFGEYGLFARRQWEKYEIIGEYCGLLSKYNEIDEKTRYLAQLYIDESPEDTLYIDANQYGNETRFINDYRNIALEPNTTFVSSNISGKQHILIIVTKQIKPYTEILADYGNDYWNYHSIK